MNAILKKWTPWLLLNLLILSYFGYALVSPASSVKTSLLPGETTHGHYQIELDCNACHKPVLDPNAHSSSNVMQDACNQCHAAQLKQAKDTHPASKFNDPTNADRLLVLDAQNCLTCHREHVPDQTLALGLTVPQDYCWHCHQEVADTRPSHAGMAFDSCATAGCHNYHDNRALYEKFLYEHADDVDHFAVAVLPQRKIQKMLVGESKVAKSLGPNDADMPASAASNDKLIADWAKSAHAAVDVNCTGCHLPVDQSSTTSSDKGWSDSVDMATCGKCHDAQVETFLTGKHGMRLARDLPPMQPSMARLEMHVDASHRALSCNACHQGHRYDTQFAAVEACLQCHADQHSMAYKKTAHAELYRQELSGDLPAGSGVTCATCHMPRLPDEDSVFVSHDQNASLRPSETMARQVCSHCHGLEFSLSSLADSELAASCFDAPPKTRIESVKMAEAWFKAREEARAKRKQKRKD